MDASLASLRNFFRGHKQNGHLRQLLNYVLGNIFASKPLRNNILVSTPMLSGSRNPITIKKSCMYDTFSRWPPYKYEQLNFKPHFGPRIRNTSLCDVVLVNDFDIYLYYIAMHSHAAASRPRLSETEQKWFIF